MSQANAVTAQPVATRKPAARKPSAVAAENKALELFSVSKWRTNLDTTAAELTTAGKQVLDLVLAGRDKVELDTAKEAIQHAFANAYALLNGVTFDEACKAKSVQNRVSDALCVFKAKVLPASLPSHLQGAAKACREANAKAKEPANGPVSAEGEGGQEGSEGSSRKSKAAKATSLEDINPVDLLDIALNHLAKQCASNEVALSLVTELKELAGDLLLAMLDVREDAISNLDAA